MSREGLKQFRKTVLSRPDWQRALFEKEGPDGFAALASRIATDGGFEVSREEVLDALRSGRQEWQYRWFSPESINHGHWLPIGIQWQNRRAVVDWAYFGAERLTAPFFEDSVRRTLRRPFNVLWRHQTPADTPAQLPLPHPGLPPSALIYHMSRCGSTLLGQMYAALESVLVLSEAPPIDAVIRAPELSQEERVAWLRWVMAALAQPRTGSERYLLVKLDSWHILDWPLFERAFPGTPSAFLYRDPVEVLVSHARRRGSQMVPGSLSAAQLNLSPDDVGRLPLDEYCAHVMAAFCRAALALENARCSAAGTSPGLELIEYREITDRIMAENQPLFSLSFSPDERELMKEAALRDAKNPSFLFSSDSGSKQSEATESIRTLAERLVGPVYRALNEARRAPGAFTPRRSAPP